MTHLLQALAGTLSRPPSHAPGEVSAAFQAKVALATGEIVGMEALARWNSPVFGAVPPEIFIPLAERHGLIDRLTNLVLHDALDACARLRGAAPALTVAVNISPLLLEGADLAERLLRALETAGLPPQALVAEVTESHAIGDFDHAGATLAALRRAGIACAIDDFGTGHASLLSLLRLPFNELKIDRAFVAACDTDPDSAKIVRATLGLAREMELHVVAEGIESPGAETALRRLGCATGQGFRYGRPMPAETLMQTLAKSRTAAQRARRRASPGTAACNDAAANPRNSSPEARTIQIS